MHPTADIRILFVFRTDGHGKGCIPYRQIASLESYPISMGVYPLKNSGLFGYFKAFFSLRKYLKGKNYSIIHAHYGLSGMLLMGHNSAKRICSLMGSEVYNGVFLRLLLRFFAAKVWDLSIVKSVKMQKLIHGSIVLPNGVNTEMFKPLPREFSREELRLDKAKFYILFVAVNPLAKVKNITLAREAVKKMNSGQAELLVVSGKDPEELRLYYNAADVLIITSLTEGSPNVLKEALACDLNVVSVDAGDAWEHISGIEGCIRVSYDAASIANALLKIKNHPVSCHGREYCMKHLDEKIIAGNLWKEYNKLLKSTEK